MDIVFKFFFSERNLQFWRQLHNYVSRFKFPTIVYYGGSRYTHRPVSSVPVELRK